MRRYQNNIENVSQISSTQYGDMLEPSITALCTNSEIWLWTPGSKMWCCINDPTNISESVDAKKTNTKATNKGDNEFFLELFKSLDIKTDTKKYPGFIFYFKDETLMFQYQNTGFLNCSQEFIRQFKLHNVDSTNEGIQNFIQHRSEYFAPSIRSVFTITELVTKPIEEHFNNPLNL